MCNISEKTKEFISKAVSKYGVKFDYSKVDYKTNKIKVTLICNNGHEFDQIPKNHLRGDGCPTCANKVKTKTTDQFIKEAKEIHGDKFDYSKVNYKQSNIKVTLICNNGHEFEQRPSNHLRGQGCQTCANEAQTKIADQFIMDAKAIHGDKFDYSKVNYKQSHTKITLICNKNHEFKQMPNDHLRGQGCPACANEAQTKTADQFIMDAKAIHGNKFDYSKVNYKTNRIKVNLICDKGHEFEQRPTHHLRGQGCPACANESQTKTADQFIMDAKAIHGNKFDYSKVNYKISKIKVTLICDKGHEFKQRPSSHLSGYGCPKCSKSISKPETIWLDILGIPIRNISIRLSNGKLIKPDGYDPITNTIYEYNGEFSHGHPEFYNPTDINPQYKKTYGVLYQNTLLREQWIKNDGYNLVTIWGKEFLKKYSEQIKKIKKTKGNLSDN